MPILQPTDSMRKKILRPNGKGVFRLPNGAMSEGAILYVLTVNLETELFCEFPITTVRTSPALTATGLSIAAGRTL